MDFWRQQITGYKNVDRLKMKLAEHGAVFMTTEQAGISLPKRNWIKVKTRPSPLYWKFWNDRYIAIDSANLGEFELDADFYGSNAHCERELIGDTSLTRRLYARQLCGLYNPARYEAFRDLVNSTEDRLIVFYNFTEEMERLKGIAKVLNRPVSVLSGGRKRTLMLTATSITALPLFSIRPVQWAAISSLPTKSFTSAFPKVRNCGSNPKSVFTALGKNGPVSIT